MRWKPVGRAALVLLVLIAALAIWKREELARLDRVNALFAADRIVENLSGMDALFRTMPVRRGDGPVRALPRLRALCPRPSPTAAAPKRWRAIPTAPPPPRCWC
jgi:hypothetical protein